MTSRNGAASKEWWLTSAFVKRKEWQVFFGLAKWHSMSAAVKFSKVQWIPINHVVVFALLLTTSSTWVLTGCAFRRGQRRVHKGSPVLRLHCDAQDELWQTFLDNVCAKENNWSCKLREHHQLSNMHKFGKHVCKLVLHVSNIQDRCSCATSMEDLVFMTWGLGLGPSTTLGVSGWDLCAN